MRFWLVGIAEDGGEANGVPEVAERQSCGDDGVEAAGDAEEGGPKGGGDHEDGVEERLPDGGAGGPCDGLLGGGEADAAVAVVVAVEPADSHEVRELPDEEDGEEGDCGPLDEAARRGPADERRKRAGKCADKGIQGADALQRRVDGDVGRGGKQGDGGGERVGLPGEDKGPDEDGCEAEQQAVREADATGHHRAIGGAMHARVGAALERLVEHGGAAGDERDAGERADSLQVQGADAGAQVAEVKAGGGGDEDHERHARLEQRCVVGGERGRAPRRSGQRSPRLWNGPRA